MHRIEMTVRDSETYVGGIVHNSNYFNYLEHGRNAMLREAGIDFFQLASEQGIKFTQTQSEQFYKYPLKANDTFYVITVMEKASAIQYRFVQEIRRQEGDQICLEASTLGVLTNEKGQPIRPPKEVLERLALMGVQ